MSDKIDLKARHKAREYAVQALYQWSLAQQSLADIEAQFIENSANKRVEHKYLIELIQTIPTTITELDACFEPHLSRKIAEIDLVELAILRLSTYELKNRIDIPYQVVINEALELTKKFGSIEGFKFVNGVLDKTAADLRQTEKAARK